jgi:hypothetical protein
VVVSTIRVLLLWLLWPVLQLWPVLLLWLVLLLPVARKNDSLCNNCL